MTDFSLHVEALKKVQELRLRTDKLDKEIAKIPKAIDEEKRTVDGFKEQADDAKHELLKAKASITDLESQVKAKLDYIEKLKVSLYTVKDNQTYKKTQEEIEHNERAISDIETKILEAIERMESKNAELLSAESSLAEKQALHDDFISKKNRDLAELEKAKAAFIAEIEKYEVAVEKGLLDRFNRLRTMRGGTGLAFAQPEPDYWVCGNCQVQLTHQEISLLLLQRQICTCQACGVIMVIENDLYHRHEEAMKKKRK
ncbi:MAG: hypothetical protein NUW37_14210 [Planctomycetes bacterium]|nr:hypothetical protein [Planctomycetota bacterium]